MGRIPVAAFHNDEHGAAWCSHRVTLTIGVRQCACECEYRCARSARECACVHACSYSVYTTTSSLHAWARCCPPYRAWRYMAMSLGTSRSHGAAYVSRACGYTYSDWAKAHAWRDRAGAACMHAIERAVDRIESTHAFCCGRLRPRLMIRPLTRSWRSGIDS